MLRLQDNDQTRFYSTMAVTNTMCVALTRKKLLNVLENHEKRLLNDRRDFMTNIEEFKDISRTVLTKIIAPEVFETV